MVVVKIGVIALQGDVSEHVAAMQKVLGERGSVVLVRQTGIVPECDGLVLPGGESTTLSRQIAKTGIDEEIKNAAAAGVPVLATCAGMVLVSRDIQADAKVRPLGLMDSTVDRNIFGSQRESFEANLEVEGFDSPFRAVFIRSPAIVRAGKGVQVLARVEGNAVAARQKNVLCLAFHPELTNDMRFHQLFLDMIGEKRHVLR
jgi:5'-phosphate synthase pdxT subunit